MESAKTLTQRAGVRPDISERVLAHAIKGVAGIYDKFGYLPQKLDAPTRLDALVESILKTIDWVAPSSKSRARTKSPRASDPGAP
jgi:hypothetical protein